MSSLAVFMFKFNKYSFKNVIMPSLQNVFYYYDDTQATLW